MGLQARRKKNLLHGSKKVRAARDRARALRIKHGLCLHSDDERTYANAELSATDKTPAAICDQCGRPKLIVKAINQRFAEDELETGSGVKVPARLLVEGLLK